MRSLNILIAALLLQVVGAWAQSLPAPQFREPPANDSSTRAATTGWVRSNARLGTWSQPGGVARSIEEKLREVVNVRDYGAVCNDSTDDTAAIQAALNSLAGRPAEIVFPAMCRVSAALTMAATGTVSAPQGGGIRTTSATADVLVVTAPFVRIEGLTFDRTVLRTGGAYVKAQAGAHRVSIHDTTMNDPFVGVHLVGPPSPRLTTNRIYWYSAASPASVGILVDGGLDGTISGASVNGNPAGWPEACLKITSTGDLTVGLSNFIGCGRALYAVPTSGLVVASLRVYGSYFDSTPWPIDLHANGGAIVRSDFHQVWAGGGTVGNGVTMRTSGAGQIDGVTFNGLHALLNADAGLSILNAEVTNTRVVASDFSANGSVGIYTAGGVGRYHFSGNTVGPTLGLGGNAAGGMSLGGGTVVDVVVTGNKVKGNGGASPQINADFGPAANRIVADNLAPDDGWTAYTPTLSAASGTLTSASATGRYKARGSTLFVEITATITTNGSAAGALRASLPSGVAAAARATLVGREDASTGAILQGAVVPGGTIISITDKDNAYPGGNGRTVVMSGALEIQ